MKTNAINSKSTLLLIAAVLLAIFITRPVFSQEKAKKESYKKIVVKVVSDDNGKTTVIDTTMEYPDSTMIDSIQNEISKVMTGGKGGRHNRIYMRKLPGGKESTFTIKCTPDCRMDMKDMEDMDIEDMVSGQPMEDFDMPGMIPGQCQKMMHSGGNGQTLNDLLGEIPMDRVVSYKIKDTKNGKRITIDLKDAPLFEQQSRVIIIREPGRNGHDKVHQNKQMKMYMKSMKGHAAEEENEQQVSPPPPPPPPPSSEPGKTAPKKL